MKIFLDTSTLVKLYHKEVDSGELEFYFSESKITGIYLSELSKAEFSSAFWKKYRTKELDKPSVVQIINLFQKDFAKYFFVPVSAAIIDAATLLLSKYCEHGLRALDSIQLSTCVELRNNIQKYFSSDKLLSELINQEGLPC